MRAFFYIAATLLMAMPTGAGAVTDDSELSDEERVLIEQALGEDGSDALAPAPEVLEEGASRTVGTGVVTQSMMNPAIALIADFALAYFDSDEPLQGGAHDPSRTGFNLQQLELHAESKIDHHFDLQVNLVFSEFGVEVEELYVQTLSLPASLQLRVGQFLMPFGRINATHPHTWKFVDQTLMVGTFFGGEGGRGLGLETSWLAPLPWFVKLTGSLNQKAGQCCSISYFKVDEGPIDGLEDFLYTGRLEQFFEMNEDWALLLGFSQVVGQNATGPSNQTHLRAGDVLIKYKPVRSSNRFYSSLQLEWTHRQRQVPGALYESHAGYLEWATGLNPSWEVAARAEWIASVGDKVLDPALDGTRQRYAGQVTYYPSHFSRIRLQASVDEPGWRDEPIWSGMLAFEVLAGAHGAHRY